MKLSCIIIRFRSFGVRIHRGARARAMAWDDGGNREADSAHIFNEYVKWFASISLYGQGICWLSPSLYGLVFILWSKGDDDDAGVKRRTLFNYATRTHKLMKYLAYTFALSLSLSILFHSQWIFIIDESIRSWCKQHKHTQATHKVDNHWIKCVNVFMKHSKLPPFSGLCHTLRITKIRWDLFCFMRLLLVNAIVNKSAAYSFFFSSLVIYRESSDERFSTRWMYTVHTLA